MIDALLSDVLADAADHPGCRASADGWGRVLLTGSDGRVVRMYECRGPIDAELIASQADAHLRPLDQLADDVAKRMAANPGATLVAVESARPLAGHVQLITRNGAASITNTATVSGGDAVKMAVSGWMRGWWSVGTHQRALQLVALVAARQNQQPRQEQQA